MPGYDSTGPVGAGPRTGRDLGRCRRGTEGTRPVEGPSQKADGAGVNCRSSANGRGRGVGNGGRGRRRGFQMGWRTRQDTDSSDVTPRRRQAFLRRRIRDLTEQLDAVNRLLSDDSRRDVQERE